MGEWGKCTAGRDLRVSSADARTYSTGLKEALAQYGISIRVQDAMQDLLSEPLTRAVLSAIYVCCKTPAPDHWIALRETLLELQGLGDDVDRTHKAVSSLSAFVRHMRTRLEAQMGVLDMVSLINEFLAFLGRSSFCLRHEQYRQADFLTKTINDCASALINARSRRTSWVDALADRLNIGFLRHSSFHCGQEFLPGASHGPPAIHGIHLDQGSWIATQNIRSPIQLWRGLRREISLK